MVDWLEKLLGPGGSSLHFNFDFLNHNKSRKNITKTITKTTTKDSSVGTVNTHYHGPVTHVNYVINGNVLPEETLKELQPIVGGFESKQIALLADDPRQLISAVQNYEQEDDVTRGLINFFTIKLSPRDFQLMRTGLFLKHLRDTDQPDKAEILWKQNVLGVSLRERRIIELAAEGYFDTHFRPLYKKLLRLDSTRAQQRFDEQFRVLDDPHFVIFVHSNMSIESIVNKATLKAIQNIKYGVNEDIISIHATGNRLVSRVEKATIELRKTFPNIYASIDPPGSQIIKAEIRYRDNNLTPDQLED